MNLYTWHFSFTTSHYTFLYLPSWSTSFRYIWSFSNNITCRCYLFPLFSNSRYWVPIVIVSHNLMVNHFFYYTWIVITTHVTMLQEITWCSKWTTATFEGTKECFSPICKAILCFFRTCYFKWSFLVYFLSQNEHWSYKLCSNL